jgi:hypothetical protein
MDFDWTGAKAGNHGPTRWEARKPCQLGELATQTPRGRFLPVGDGATLESLVVVTPDSPRIAHQIVRTGSLGEPSEDNSLEDPSREENGDAFAPLLGRFLGVGIGIPCHVVNRQATQVRGACFASTAKLGRIMIALTVHPIEDDARSQGNGDSDGPAKLNLGRETLKVENDGIAALGHRLLLYQSPLRQPRELSNRSRQSLQWERSNRLTGADKASEGNGQTL